MTQGKWTAIVVVTLALAGCSEPVVEVIPVVQVIPVASITIDAVSASLLPGVTVQLTARAVGPDGQVLTGRTITFSGGNSIARVSNTGMVTTLLPGTVTVTASAEGQAGTRDLTVNYPVPTLTAVEPGVIPTGIASYIIVRGTGFFPGTVVRLNGVARQPTSLSYVAAYVNLSAADVATVGTAAITVFNPTPGGGTSGSLPLSVQPAILCDVFTPLTLGTTVAGALDPTDCNSGPAGAPFYQDVYKFTTTALTAVTFTMTSSAFNSFLSVADGTNSAALHAITSATRPNPATMRLLLPARTFAVIPGAVNSGAVGAYTFASTTSTPPAITNCENWYVVPAMTLAGTVTPTDCADGVWYWDVYSIVLRAGQTVTITLESTAFNAALWLYDTNGLVVEDDNGGGGTNAQIVFTSTAGGVFFFEAGPSSAIGSTGAYTLRIH